MRWQNKDFYAMFSCVCAATKRRLSVEQINWLLQYRERAEYFEQVMKVLPDVARRSG